MPHARSYDSLFCFSSSFPLPGGAHGVARGKVFELEEAADLDLGLASSNGTRRAHSIALERLHLDQPVAGDQFLRLGKRTVDNRPLAAVE